MLKGIAKILNPCVLIFIASLFIAIFTVRYTVVVGLGILANLFFYQDDFVHVNCNNATNKTTTECEGTLLVISFNLSFAAGYGLTQKNCTEAENFVSSGLSERKTAAKQVVFKFGMLA